MEKLNERQLGILKQHGITEEEFKGEKDSLSEINAKLDALLELQTLMVKSMNGQN